MASILADIGTAIGAEIRSLLSRLSDAEDKNTTQDTSILNLSTRLTSAENEIVTLGGQVPPPTGDLTIEPVQWTNLTEINLSGEKAQNASFDPPPVGLGVEVEVLVSWTNGGKNAQVGEIYEIVLVQDTGGMKLTGNGQSLFASANQIANQTRALHPSEGQVVETITEFTADLVGREVRAVQDQSSRNMVQGEIYTLTNFVSANQMTHSGGANIIIGQQTTYWELLSEVIRKPYLWEVKQGVIDQDKLKLGIIKGGSDASTAVQQMFDSPLVIGTKVVVKVERSDTNSGSVAFKHVKLDGNTRGGDVHVPRDPGYVEYEVTDSDMHGIRFGTMFGSRELSSISVFQGEVSGGTVQANGNGGLEKIAGASAFNAGASSTNFIEGNSNGYVQFQWGAEFKSQRIGLTYQDVDFESVSPFQMTINGNGHVFTNGSSIFSGGNGWATQGDYFRIRHYAVDNTIRFQRRETIYQDDVDFCLLQTCGLQPNNGQIKNHTFDEDGRPLIKAKKTTSGGLIEDQFYQIYSVNTETSSSRIYDLDGTLVNWLGGRGTDWEVQKSIGTDYVTFHTHSDLTNGNSLYVDTSLFHIGSLLNDVLLAR